MKNKLEEFNKSCIQQANNEAMELNKQLEEQINNVVREVIEEYEKISNQRFKIYIKELEHKYNSELWNLNKKSQIKLSEKNNEILDDFSKELESKLIKFVLTDEYESFLLKNVKQATEMLEGEIVIYLTKKDITKFFNQFNNYRIEEMDNEKIGGCIAKNDNIVIDNTLKEIIHDTILDLKMELRRNVKKNNNNKWTCNNCNR